LTYSIIRNPSILSSSDDVIYKNDARVVQNLQSDAYFSFFDIRDSMFRIVLNSDVLNGFKLEVS
jgi:hypothetical protein